VHALAQEPPPPPDAARRGALSRAVVAGFRATEEAYLLEAQR
jgi:hypothetical protein